MAALRADIDLRVNSQGVKRSLDKATSEINKAVSKISGKTVNFNVNGKSFTQPLGRINASANEFTKSLEASNARVIAFGASVAILDGISDSFKALVSEAVAFEKTLADINVVLNLSNQQIQQFGDGLFEAARNTAQGFNVASEAAIEFARQGLSTEEVLKRTNDALILTRLTSLKASDAVAGLTAAVNAFGDAGLTTTDIIDKLSAVDVNFAVSSEDLINALQRAGAVAIDAGVEFDSLVGLVAALQQTTARGGAVIGNSLKTIFTRIQRPESIRQLEEMGVAVRELSGSILPADKILLNIAKTFDALTQSQQSNVVQFSAGIFQANVFRAALRDLAKEQSLHVKATDISANAAGEAAIKNEKLNKTLAAMASQTGTGLQELAQTMGDLSLSPAIGDALEFINERIKELKGSLGGGEEEGSTFAKGLVRGIGNVITGPAAIAFGAIFIKLFINIAKFAKSSMKDVLGIVSQKEKLKQMEESIVNVLMQERFIQEGLNNLEGDRAAQETFILGILERQSNAMREQQKLAAAMAGRLLKAGVNPDLSPSSNFVDFDGDGRRDTFDSSRVTTSYGGLNPEVVKKEKDGARKGGYSPGKVDQMNVPGVGKVVYNKAETVKKFPGMKQPAIMPPKQSRAGTTYKEAFTERHGFDPYASHGLIPNFATQVGGALEMDMGKLTLFGKRPDIERAFGIPSLEKEFKDAAGAPIVLKAQAGLEDIVKSTGAQDVTKTRLFKPFSAIAAQKGITTIKRPFQVRTLPRGQIKDAQDAERKTANLLNQEAKQSGLKQTHTLTSGAAKNKKGRNDYPVDIIAYGSDLNSHEVKSGKFSMANIISKSLRMSSDRELATWMSLNKVSGGSALTEANFKKAQSLAGKLKIAGTGADGEFTQEDADLWGMSKGLVPNFATEKEVFNKDGRTVSANKEYQLHDGSGFFMPTKGQTAVGLTDLIAGQLVDASGSLTSASVQLADLLNPSTVVSHGFPKTREADGRSFEENLGPRAYLGKPPSRTGRFDWEMRTAGDVDLGAGKYSPDLDINPRTINNSILGEAATSAKAHTATDLINKAWNNSVAKSGLTYTYNNAGGEMIITMPKYLTEYVGQGEDGWAITTNAINYSLGGATVSKEVDEAVKQGKTDLGKSKWIDPSKVYVEVYRDQVNAARGFVPNFSDRINRTRQLAMQNSGASSKELEDDFWPADQLIKALESNKNPATEIIREKIESGEIKVDQVGAGGDLFVIKDNQSGEVYKFSRSIIEGDLSKFSSDFEKKHIEGIAKTQNLGTEILNETAEAQGVAKGVPAEVTKITRRKDLGDSSFEGIPAVAQEHIEGKTLGEIVHKHARRTKNAQKILNEIQKGFKVQALVKKAKLRETSPGKLDEETEKILDSFIKYGADLHVDNVVVDPQHQQTVENLLTNGWGLDNFPLDSLNIIDFNQGLIPNFESTTLMRGQPVIEKNGQLIHPELAQPSVNQMLFEPLLKAETPDDVARIAAKFAASHSSGPLAGRNREKTTGSIGDMFEERLSSSRVDEGKMRIWENDMDPYGPEWISQKGGTLSSGAVSYTTNENVAKMFTSSEHPAAGKIHEKEIPRKLIFGERKIKKLLSRGADLEKEPPEYPMINLMKDSIYNDTFFDWWKQQGGLYLNLGGFDRDPIISKNSLDDHGIYNEKEITQILSKGLVPNFANMYQISAKMPFGKYNSGLFDSGLFLQKQSDVHSILKGIDEENGRFSGVDPKTGKAIYKDMGYGITTFQMPDQNLKAMLSGVYSAGQIKKLRTLSDRFLDWRSPDYIDDDEEEYLARNSLFDMSENREIFEEYKGRKKGFEYIREKNENLIRGTKENPMPLAGEGAWQKYNKAKFYLIPDTGLQSGDIRDSFSRSDDEEISRLFGLKKVKTKAIDDKYLENLKFAEDISEGDNKKLRAAQEGGIDKMNFATKTKSQGLLPNFAKDWRKIYSQIIQQRDTIDSREDFKKFGVTNPPGTFPFDKSTTVYNSAIKSNLTPEQYNELWNIYHGLSHGAAKNWSEIYSQIIQQRDTIDSREDFKKFGVSNPSNAFALDKSTTLKNSAIKSSLTPEQYDELWNIYHGLERNSKYDWRAIFKDLKKGEYQNRQDFFDKTGITQGMFNTIKSPKQLQGQTIQRHLGKQDYEKFRQLLKNLPGGTKYGAGAGKPAQYIRGDAFEKLIVEQAFDRVYSPGPGALDIENIDPSYFNDRNKKLFDIDGTYEHGDPIFTTNRKGHGSPKILKKLANSQSTSARIRNKINDVLSKPGRRPNTIDLGAFPVADMIGNTSQKGIEFEDAEVMPVEIDSMPNVFRDIDPSTRLKFSYIKDYLTIPTKQHDLINSLQQGSKLPSSEQLGEGLNAKGLIPNFGYMPIHQTKNGKNYVWEKDLNIAKKQYPRAEFKQWDKNPKMYFVSGDTTYGRTQEEIEKDILKFSDERRVKEFGRFAASKGYPQVYAGFSKAITSEKVTSAYGRNYDRAAGKTRTVYPTQLSIPELKNVTVEDIDDIMLQDLYGSESFSNVGKKYASDFVKKPTGTKMVRLGTEEREYGTYKRSDLLPKTGEGKIPESTIRQLYDEFKSKHGASNGLVPNFTKQFVPSFADITDHEIIDKETGTITKYSTNTETPGHAEIIGARRGPENLKGGAFNNFNQLVKEFNQVGSGEVMPQRNGFGSTSWAKIVTMFPQIKQRIQKGLETEGSFRLNNLRNFDFDNLVGLKKITNTHFKQAEAAQDPKLTQDQREQEAQSSLLNGYKSQDPPTFYSLLTRKVQGDGDARAEFKNKGLIPNFADISSGMQSLATSNGLVPNFINIIDTDRDRNALLLKWQNKMNEIKELASSGKPKAEIDPTLSKLNGEANKIWEQIQQLKFSGLVPNFANKGFVPNYNVKLKGKNFEDAEIKQALGKIYQRKNKGKKASDESLNRAVQKYIALIEDHQKESEGGQYPGEPMTIDGVTFNSNEVALALNKQGNYYAPKEGETVEEYNKGLVPNFASMAGMPLYRGITREKGPNYTNKDVFELNPKRQNQFRSGDIYDIEGLKEYLLGHVDNQGGSSLVSTSTQEKTARDFATTKDPLKQGIISKKNISLKRIYNPKKVEKLINFVMDKKGWSEAKSVQWFLENAKNKDIGFHMKRFMEPGSSLERLYGSENEVALLGKSAFAKTDNLAIASRGLVPNFSNPLNDAIDREKAAGVPSSRIRIEKSSQLKSRANPMGLAVTNTRDEPAGINQGIRRAKRMKIDPKTHGASRGLIPNYASSEEDVDKIYEKASKSVKFDNLQKGIDKLSNSVNKLNNVVSDSVGVNQDRIDSDEEVIKASEGRAIGDLEGLQKLFFLQSGISMVNGFLQEFAETGSGATKQIAEMGNSATNVISTFIAAKELTGQIASMGGAEKESDTVSLTGSLLGGESKGLTEGISSFASSIKSASGGLGKIKAIAGGLLRFAPAIGQLVTVVGAANEVFKHFNDGEGLMSLFYSASERASKNIEKLSESTEALQAGFDSLTSRTENNEKIKKLEEIGSLRTQKQEVELQQLKMKDIDLQIKSQKAISKLFDENLMTSEIANKLQESFSSTSITIEEQKETLQKLIMVQKQRIAIEEGTKAFGDIIEDKLDNFFGLDSNDQKLLKQSSAFRGSQLGMSIGSVISSDQDTSDQEKLDILQQNINALSSLDLNRLSGSEGASQIKNEMIQGLKGTELFGSAIIAESISSMIDTIDNAEDNVDGLANIEVDATKDALAQLIKQLQKQKDSIQDAQMGNSISQSEAAIRAEYLKIIANYKKQNQDSLHQLSLLKSRNETENKILTSNNNLLQQYGAISKASKISKQNSLDIANIQSEFKEKLEKSNLEFSGSILGVAEKVINIEAVANTFKENLESAGEGANKLRDALSRDIEFGPLNNSIGINLDKGQQQEVQSSFASVVSNVSDIDDNSKIINNLFEQFKNLSDPIVKAAYLLALETKGIAKVTPELKNKIKELLDSMNRSAETAEEDFKNKRKILESEKIQKLIQEKTTQGAVEILKLVNDRKDINKALLKDLQGEADTLAALNYLQKDRIKTLLSSKAFDQKAYEMQVEKNRTDAESALLSLKQLQVQQELLRSSEDFKTTQQIKFQQEIISAGLSAQDAADKNEYLSYNETRKRLAQAQIDTETEELEITARNNLTKLKLLTQGEDLSKQIDLQIQEEITSAQSSALFTSAKALALTQMNQQGELLRKANELQESSNKLLELENAVRKANVSEAELRANVGIDLAKEKLGSIRETRESAARFSMTGNPEDALAFAQSLEKTNKALGNGTQAFDRLRVKMEEINVSAANLSGDLISTGIDGAKTGLKQLFEDISSGAKESGAAWEDFGLNLAKKIFDRITEHNIDNIIKNFTYAFTGQDTQSDAEKITGSNNHLVEATKTLAGEMHSLRGQVAALTEALLKDIKDRPEIGSNREGSAPSIESPNVNRNKGEELAQVAVAQAKLERKIESQSQNNINKSDENTQKAKEKVESKQLNNVIESTEIHQEKISKKYEPQHPAIAELQANLNKQPVFERNIDLVGYENLDKAATGFGQSLSSAIPHIDQFKEKLAYPTEQVPPEVFDVSTPSYTAESVQEKNNHLNEVESGKLAALLNSGTSQSGVKADNVNIDNISSEISSSLQQNSTSLDSNTSKVDQATNNVSEFSNALSSSAGQIEGLGAAVQNVATVINNAAASVKTNSSTTITTNATSTTNNQSGGIIRRFNKGGFVQGPPGIDNVPAMLTAGEFVIPKEETRKLINGGIINKFDEGGTVEGNKGSFADRMTAGIKGAAQTAVLSAVASKYSADLPSSSGKKPPEFDMKRFETIDLGSTVSLHRADPRISAKRMAQDPVMQDYKKHLLDLAQYRVDETNRKQSEKQSKRMGLVQAGMSAVASFAVSKLSDALKEPMNKVVQKGENFVKGNLGLGKHSEAFKAAKEMSPDINYSDVADSIENKTPLSFDGYDYVPEVSKSGSTNWVSADRVKDFHKTGIDVSQANILSSIMSSQGRESGVDKLNKKIASDSSGFTDPKNFSPERRALQSQVSERVLPKPLQVLRKVPIVNNFIPSREAINNPGKGYNSNFGDVGSAFKRILGGGQTKEYTNHRGQIVRQQGIFPLSEQVEDAGFKKAREEYRQEILDSGGSDPGEYEDYSQSFFRDMFPMFKKTKRSQSGGTIRMFNEGGLNKGQGQVPAMLTAGEAFIPSSIAKRIGYETLNKINTTGEIPIVQGKGGIDNVGPVGLTEGDFIIKKSSTDKLLRENPNTMRFAIQNPEGFKRGDMGYYEGGIVGTGQSSKVYTPTAQPTRQSSQEQASPQNRISSLLQESNVQAKESSSAGTQAITNNINVSVKIDKNGKEQVSTEGAGGESKDSYEKEQELAMKIKSKVLEVIREEKRVGGELN